MRYALKFGYDGRRFHGFSRQPGQRTVEGDILDALEKMGVLGEGKGLRDIDYGAASRTDAGVSAVGNVIALTTDFRKGSLLPALNARLDDVWFHSIAGVPDGFRARHARLRWYRYHLATDEIGDWEVLKMTLSSFVGTHDFTNFSRAEGGNAVRSITRMNARKSGPFITVDLFSQGFLWNMVRRIIGASLAHSRGELKKKELESALNDPRRRVDLGLAPPEPLFLMDVSYDFKFEPDGRALELARRRLQKKRKEAMGTIVLASYLMPTIGTTPSAARRPSSPRL